MNQTENRTDEKNASAELLDEMYRNVTMGSETLSDIVPAIRDKFLLRGVTAQLEQYADYTRRVTEMLEKQGMKPKEASLMKKTMSKGGIMVNTMLDSTESHLRDMIRKGTETGVHELERQLTALIAEGADGESVSLCRDIIAFENKIVADYAADAAK